MLDHLPKAVLDYIEAEKKAAFDLGFALGKTEAERSPVGRAAANSNPAELSSHQTTTSDENFPLGENRVPRGLALAKGVPEMLLTQAFKELAPNHASATLAAESVLRASGTVLPSTTLHRTVRRLLDEGVIERIGKTKTYRFSGKSDSDSPGRDAKRAVVVELGKRTAQ